MSGFKLLAIRPLKGCSPKFLKVLKAGKIYRFYNDYTFYNNSNKEHNIDGDISKIELNSKVPEDLYNVNDVNLNITAVVGQNGSGKSSLIELLFVANFLLAMQENILKNHSKKDESIEETLERLLKERERLSDELEIIFKNEEFVKKTPIPYSAYEKEIRNSVYQKLNLDKKIKWKTDEIDKLSKLIEEYNDLKEVIKIEVFYQISQTVFKLRIHPEQKDRNCQIEIVPTNFSHLETESFETRIKRDIRLDKVLKNPLDLSEIFFYSLVLNYSQYALNSNEIGNWITELFHKNDGYQTPIVINPMRTEGNFDINTENELVKQRLLVNVFNPLNKDEKIKDSLRNLAQNHIAHRVKITLNKNKFKNEKGIEELKFLNNYKEEWEIIKDKLLKTKQKRTGTKWDDYAKDYIIGKLISMAEKYPPYYEFYDGKKLVNLIAEEGEEEKQGYLDLLENDDSHIAYKFHQAINFLKYNYAKSYFNAQKPKNINDLAEELKIKSKELKHLIPPSFLTVDILFDEKSPKNEGVEETNTLQNLSSGEKQYLYSISSIMYHLRYLDSVKSTEKKENGNVQEGLKYKYQYVNLVFDEIELYYHPELQRQFIHDFRNAVERCNLISIKNINCTFVTHSPFILSDIPKSNILMLKDGKEKKEEKEVKTFAANIHEILGESFFLENGYVGEFVKTSIEQLLDFYEKTKAKKKVPKNNLFTREKALEFIALIDDDLISDRLKEIHRETFQEKEKEIQSKEYEQWLQSELERIKNG